mmetsp:Transcript_1772/g.3956  ORF Transcript_1772/g.3956 Transcript_1772/m.3956 type:complete len:215 (+) Transcript_1772:24-668(+)
MRLWWIWALSSFAGRPASNNAEEEFDAQQRWLGKDLACSACAHVTHHIRLVLGKAIKSSMGKKEKKKILKAEFQKHKAEDGMCSQSRLPEKLAIMGKIEDGNRTYEDMMEFLEKGKVKSGLYQNISEAWQQFDDLWKKNQCINNLCFKKDLKEDVMSVCESIVFRYQSLLQKEVLKWKDRVGQFNFEHLLCVQQAKLCNQTVFHKYEADEDEEL